MITVLDMEPEGILEERILKAASEVFLEKGIQGARMQEIADLAGINKSMLHFYFRSKEKLLDLILVPFARSLFSTGSDILNRPSPGRPKTSTGTCCETGKRR
jgi:TetR/AcrR family transcriptional regulator